MKTRSIARGIVGSVAALLGVMAAGCSAETGAPGDEAQIGSTAEALQSIPNSGLTDYRVQKAGSCRFYDSTNSKEYVAMFGGIDSSTAVTSRVIMAPDVASPNDTWAVQTAMTNARHSVKTIQISDTLCAVIGGYSNVAGTAGVTDVEIYELTSGNPATIARSSNIIPLALPTARGGHEVQVCKDTNNKLHAVVAGGVNTVGGSVTKIAISDDLSKVKSGSVSGWSAWTEAASPALLAGRTEFGFGKNESANQYIVTGGKVPGGSNYTSTIELFTLDSSCSSLSLGRAKLNSNHANNADLSVAVRGLVSPYEGTADTFLATAGIQDNSGTPQLTALSDKIVVNDWTNKYVTITSSFSALNTQTYLPTLVMSAASQAKFMLAGGSNADGTASIGVAQQYATGSGFTNKLTLATNSFAPAAAFLSTNGKVVVASGVDLSTNPDTYLADVGTFTP